jgi:hypothetical protein
MQGVGKSMAAIACCASGGIVQQKGKRRMFSVDDVNSQRLHGRKGFPLAFIDVEDSLFSTGSGN